MHTEKITLKFVGEDSWSRAVLIDENKNYYKTADPLRPFPEEYWSTPEGKADILSNLYDCCPKKDVEGEPGWPIDPKHFVIV